MKKDIRTLAALLIASAALVACSSSDDSITENQQPVNPTGKYTMTIKASKGSDAASTRALGLSGKTLNATWTDGEEVTVYEGDNNLGTLSATNSNGATCTLTGELTTAPTGSEVTLKFNTPTYTGQDGTLDYIASNCDYATATTTVTVSGNTITGTDVEFTNQQAIVKFTLIDKADGTTSLNAKPLVVSVGSTDYTITPASATSEIYVAIPGISGQTVTLTATVGDDTYTYEKSGVTFTNGQYYEITVKMTKHVSLIVNPAVGQVIGDDGKNYAAGSLPGGVTAVAKICYVSGEHGLALALEDVSENTLTWDNSGDDNDGKTAAEWCSAWNTSKAVKDAEWMLPSKDQWDYMINAAGGDTALRTGFTSVGGSNLQEECYLSSTENEGDSDRVWFYDFVNHSWGDAEPKDFPGDWVRACLAF